MTEAVAIYGQLGDRIGRADALLRLGLVQRTTDGFPAAAQSYAEALNIYRQAGLPAGQANALYHLGETQAMSGDYEPALRNLAAARDILRGLGNSRNEAVALLFLGQALSATGDHGAAAPHLAQALTFFRDHNEPKGQANALISLADLWRKTGDYPASERALAEALAISCDNDDEELIEVLNCTGSLRHSRGDLDSARASHQDALDRARDRAVPLEEGRALAGLGRCALGAGDHATALALFQQAHAVLTSIGAAEAHAIASELNACAQLNRIDS